MREQSLDEFESIFEQASIPVLDIESVALKRIAVVTKGDPLDDTILELASYLGKRFKAEVDLHTPSERDAESFIRSARSLGLEPRAHTFGSTAELVGQVSIGRSRLVLLPEPENEAARVVDLDGLVQGTKPPILIVRTWIEEPATVFGSILHSLSGTFQQTENFSYSFTLAERGGRVRLLHTIDQSELNDVRQTLQVSPNIAEETGEQLLDRLARHGERYLKAVVAAGQDRPFGVSYGLVVGEIVRTVRAALDAGSYGLLVVGSHSEGYSFVEAGDYQLMHQVRDIPVLAL